MKTTTRWLWCVVGRGSFVVTAFGRPRSINQYTPAPGAASPSGIARVGIDPGFCASDGGAINCIVVGDDACDALLTPTACTGGAVCAMDAGTAICAAPVPDAG
jgi:hypothetical protein